LLEVQEEKNLEEYSSLMNVTIWRTLSLIKSLKTKPSIY
jgi:hypothetical protein